MNTIVNPPQAGARRVYYIPEDTAFDIVGVGLLDHVIAGHESYFSFLEAGLLPPLPDI